jgi:hypothetical protein
MKIKTEEMVEVFPTSTQDQVEDLPKSLIDNAANATVSTDVLRSKDADPEKVPDPTTNKDAIAQPLEQGKINKLPKTQEVVDQIESLKKEIAELEAVQAGGEIAKIKTEKKKVSEICRKLFKDDNYSGANSWLMEMRDLNIKANFDHQKNIASIDQQILDKQKNLRELEQ